MKAIHVLLALSLVTLGFAATPAASAARCILGNDPSECLVSVETIVCVTEPCDGVIGCVGRGLVCTNRLP